MICVTSLLSPNFFVAFPWKKGLKSLSLCPNLVRTLSKEAAMERLEAKQVKGHTYYYYSKWA